jgi:signal transduction histidine kinase
VKQYFSIRSLLKTLRKPGLWFILALLVFITTLHYAQDLHYPGVITQAIAGLALDRHAFERILYLAPIVWSGFLLGWRGAFVTSLIALGCMLPRAFLFSEHPRDSMFEIGAVFIIGNVLTISFYSLRKERDYRTQLEATQKELQANIQIIQEDKKQLSTINRISSSLTQSLELNQVLDAAIDNVHGFMQVDLAQIFLLDEKAGKLNLVAYRGIPEEFARAVDSLNIGEGFNGRVAKSGEPLFVENASTDPRLTREVVSNFGITSLLSVPLKSKDKVNGTLCVATKESRIFREQEVELLTAIGNQVSVAVENARLYQEQQRVTEELRVMQQNLRYYLQQATRAQEEERKRISHELHDDTIQALVVLARRLDALASGDGAMSKENRHNLEALWQQTDDILKSLRRLSQDLRPAALDRLGLLPALEWLASNVTDNSGIDTKVSVVGDERRLTEEAAIALFRITQEALRNVWKHSGATRAEIIVEFGEDGIKVTVSDNGKGFVPPPEMGDLARGGKLGLTGMQERAQLIGGSLTIQSRPGEGTRITMELPGQFPIHKKK